MCIRDRSESVEKEFEKQWEKVNDESNTESLNKLNQVLLISYFYEVSQLLVQIDHQSRIETLRNTVLRIYKKTPNQEFADLYIKVSFDLEQELFF